MTRPSLKHLTARLASTCLVIALVACTAVTASNNFTSSAKSVAAGNSENHGPLRQILYSVNSTSAGTDVTAFRVNSDGSLTSLGTALQTSDRINLVASSGRHVFGFPADTGVSGSLVTFSARPNGRLRQSFSAPLPLGTVGLALTPPRPVLNPAGTFLFVPLAVPGEASATIVTYAVGPSGKLVLASSGSGLSIPVREFGFFSLLVNPTGTFLYASFSPPVGSPTTILQFAISSTGALTQVGTFPTSISTGATNLAITPNGNTLYLGAFQMPQVTRFSINPVTGALTEQDTVSCACGSDLGGTILINPAGTLLLQGIRVSLGGGIAFYSIDPSTGALTPLSSFTPLSSIVGLFPSFVLDSSGSFLYLTDFGRSDILGFSVSASGTVTALPGSPFPGGGGSLLLVNLKP
jgi:6-phosphogluconolactonase (cycloisomerase 2 family)